MAERLALTPDQLGMKLGMLVGMLFPLVAVFVFAVVRKTERHYKKETDR
jgi:hypothetical protein